MWHHVTHAFSWVIQWSQGKGLFEVLDPGHMMIHHTIQGGTLVTGAILPTYMRPITPLMTGRGPPCQQARGLSKRDRRSRLSSMLLHARMPINSMAGKSFLDWAFAEDDFFRPTKISHLPRCFLSENKTKQKNSWDDQDDEFSSLLWFGGIWLYIWFWL